MALRRRGQRRALLALSVTATALVAAGGLAAAPAQAATGCSAAYSIASQWSGGFVASVTVTNLGDAVSSWTLKWNFTGGESVTSAWNATVTQSGSAVTAANVSWNGGLGTNGTATFGFQGSGTPGTPDGFSLNGTACTGSPGGGGTTTTTSRTTTTTAGATTTTSRTTTTTTRTTTTTSRTTTTTGSQSTPTVAPGSYPGPGVVNGSTGIHDPSMVKKPDGTYVLVGTANNLEIKTSPDRTNWTLQGAVFPNGASWTTSYTGGSASLWAPDISYRNGQYYLYYSASSFGSQNSAIFLATSSTAAPGSWTNRGLVISSSGSVNYNAIDPNLFVDASGKWWLTFGSFWTGIKMIALDPSTGMRSGSDTAVRAMAGRSGSTAIEAPYIFKHGSYYYLWVSWDLCCKGASSTYRIMVGRSTSPTGPFVDRNGTAMTSGGGTQVLAGHGSIHGPGHQAVFADVDADVLVYHYYNDSGAPKLGINLIGYDTSGWPFVF